MEAQEGRGEVDFKDMAANLGLQENEFLEFVDLFLETTYSDLKALHSAFLKGDLEGVLETAHSIKGAAVNLGFHKIYEVARDVEMRARNSCLEGILDAIAHMRLNLETISQDFVSRNSIP